MAWEHRKGSSNRYYYRSARDSDGRAHKIYYGTGPHAAAVAEEDRTRRANQARQDQRHRTLLTKMYGVANRIDAVHEWHDILMAAALLAAGFHNHRGEWRKRRHGRQLSNTS